MSTDLTPAEQAAADVLAARHNAADATYSYSAAAFHDRARAVVAAVRPLIEAEARASYDAEEVTVNGDVYRRRALPGILSLIMKSRDEVAREGNRLASQLSKACRERDEARAELERVRNQRDERGRSNGRQTALLVEARKDRERALEQRDALAAQLDAVRELHTLERRYTDEHAETSYDTRQEAADALGITPGATHYLDVCSHCGSIEMDSGAEDYRESLWPCPTIRALDGDGVTACTGCGRCSVCRRRGVTAHSVLGIDPAERVETTTVADPEPTYADPVYDPATPGPDPLTLAQSAGHLHDWAGDLADGARADWPAGHPDIIRGIRAAADWLDARDKYETETRDARAARLREVGRRLGESFQQLGEAIRDGAAKARAARDAEETPEPAEPTWRDVIRTMRGAGIRLERIGDHGPGETFRRWDLLDMHGDEVGWFEHETSWLGEDWEIELGESAPKFSARSSELFAPADVLTLARLAGLIGDTDA